MNTLRVDGESFESGKKVRFSDLPACNAIKLPCFRSQTLTEL